MCGGAMCAGYRYRKWRAMDMLEGASIQYDAGSNADDLGPSITNSDTLQLTSFGGLAIWTRPGNGQKGSCFVVSKNGRTKKWNWCMDNQVKLCSALDSICDQWHWPSLSDQMALGTRQHSAIDGTPAEWAFRLDGWIFMNGQVKNIYLLD